LNVYVEDATFTVGNDGFDALDRGTVGVRMDASVSGEGDDDQGIESR